MLPKIVQLALFNSSIAFGSCVTYFQLYYSVCDVILDGDWRLEDIATLSHVELTSLEHKIIII